MLESLHRFLKLSLTRLHLEAVNSTSEEGRGCLVEGLLIEGVVILRTLLKKGKSIRMVKKDVLLLIIIFKVRQVVTKTESLFL